MIKFVRLQDILFDYEKNTSLHPTIRNSSFRLYS